MFIRLLAKTAFAVTLALNFQASANGELDNEGSVTNAKAQAAKDLPATLVIRINNSNNNVEVMHANSTLPADATSVSSIENANFVKMDVKSGMHGELDRDSSSSSWYFCWPTTNVYYPAYYYGGYTYNYSSYYQYNYGGYSYSYYRWSYGYGY